MYYIEQGIGKLQGTYTEKQRRQSFWELAEYNHLTKAQTQMGPEFPKLYSKFP